MEINYDKVFDIIKKISDLYSKGEIARILQYYQLKYILNGDPENYIGYLFKSELIKLFTDDEFTFISYDDYYYINFSKVHEFYDKYYKKTTTYKIKQVKKLASDLINERR